MVGPDTVAIAYCDGEVYDEMLDAMQPVPGHCIWLTDVESRDGTGLLLDTETGMYVCVCVCVKERKGGRLNLFCFPPDFFLAAMRF